MPEPLSSFLLSISCIVAAAVLIPGIETITRRVRGNSAIGEPRKIVHLTPERPRRRTF